LPICVTQGGNKEPQKNANGLSSEMQLDLNSGHPTTNGVHAIELTSLGTNSKQKQSVAADFLPTLRDFDPQLCISVERVVHVQYDA
jgi:hypothetical protein